MGYRTEKTSAATALITPFRFVQSLAVTRKPRHPGATSIRLVLFPDGSVRRDPPAMLARLSAESKTRPDASIRRALFVAAFIVCWMLAISVRLIYADFRPTSGRARATAATTCLETGPERGQLLDRQDRELARSIQTASVFVDPAELKTPGDIACVATHMASLLKLDEKSLVGQLTEAKHGGRRFLWLARRLSADQAGRSSRWLAWGSLPDGAEAFLSQWFIAAHVLGFVGLDGAGPEALNGSTTRRIAKLKTFGEKGFRWNAYERFELPASPDKHVLR